MIVSAFVLFSSPVFAALPTCGGTQGPDCMWANGKGCTLDDGHGNINQWPTNSGDDNQCTGLVGPGGGQLNQQYSADRKASGEINKYDGFGKVLRNKAKGANP